MITATNPQNIIINPISSCIELCLTNDEHVQGGQARAFFEAQQIMPVSIANGTVFTFFGQKFATGTANTYNTFVWSANAATTMNNIIAALDKNAFTSGNYTHFSTGIPSNLVSTFTWKEFGSNPALASSSPNSFLLSITSSTGADAIYTEGYQYNYELWQHNTVPTATKILKRQAVPPLLNRGGGGTNTCIDFVSDIASLLKTTFVWNNTTPIFDTTCWGRYFVKFGSQQTKPSGCGVEYMDIYSTSTFEVCNAVFQPYETQLFGAAIGVNGKMADYVHTQNPNAKFLTNRPFVNKTTSVCGDEYGNLWFCLPLAEDPLYSIVYTYYNKANAIIGSNTIGNIPSDEHRFVIVPYGPQNLLLATGTAYYTISIMHDGQDVSEMLRFNLENCGCEKEQVFFVCDHLGYDTMRFTAVETRSVSVSQTEICLDVPCGASATEGVKSGLSQTNTDAHEKFTLISDKLIMNEANLEWFISFKKSESRYILRKMSDGTKAPFRLLIESGETQIYRHDDTIQLVIECRYGFDLVTQNEG